jgi:hypothetical protein
VLGKESIIMGNSISAIGSMLNSGSAIQQTQQEQRATEVQQQTTDEMRDISLSSDSTVNDLELSVSYEVKLSEQATAAHVPPPAVETTDSESEATTESNTSTVSADTAAASSGAVVSDSSNSSTITDVSSMTEQQMQSAVLEGTITRTQMLDELTRRNGGNDEAIAAEA